jgi:hypothetical protein
MEAGINPFEVCSNDAIGEPFKAFRGAGSASVADSLGAGGWRVRWDCEDHHDSAV